MGFTDDHGNLHRTNPDAFDMSLDAFGCCIFLQRAAVRGILGEFPVYVTGLDTSKPKAFYAGSDLAAFLVQEIEEIERRLGNLEYSDAAFAADTATFSTSVRSLLQASEDVLTRASVSDPNFEAKR